MDRRKIVMILGGAWLSAMLLTWFLWAQYKAPKTERMVKIVAAARDMQAGTRIRQGDVKLVDVAEKDIPKTAIMDVKVAMDRALLFPVYLNEPITIGKVTSTTGTEGLASTIDQGKRAISVQITDASGVAGLITPRSKVDVLFTRSGTMTESITNVILEDVTVMSIGKVTEVPTMTVAGAAATAAAPAAKSPTTVATLLLTPEEAAKLELAKNQGKIGLALRNPLDRSTVGDKGLVMPEAIDPLVWTRGAKRRPGMPSPGDLAKIRDPKEWAKLTAGDEAPKPRPAVVEKKEPPKPRYTVDVFRGDKHVQETFQ